MSTSNSDGMIDVKIGIPTRAPSQDQTRLGKFDLVFPVEYGPFSRTAIVLSEEDVRNNPSLAEMKARELVSQLKSYGNKTIRV